MHILKYFTLKNGLRLLNLGAGLAAIAGYFTTKNANPVEYGVDIAIHLKEAWDPDYAPALFLAANALRSAQAGYALSTGNCVFPLYSSPTTMPAPAINALDATINHLPNIAYHGSQLLPQNKELLLSRKNKTSDHGEQKSSQVKAQVAKKSRCCNLF